MRKKSTKAKEINRQRQLYQYKMLRERAIGGEKSYLLMIELREVRGSKRECRGSFEKMKSVEECQRVMKQ